jgi:hypothetical protein
MGLKGHTRATALATMAVLAMGPAAALADPPSETYGGFHKDYSQNSVSGDYTPAIPGPLRAVVPQAAPSHSGSGFQWGDAAAGAGIALLLSGTAAGTVVAVRRRGHGQPA